MTQVSPVDYIPILRHPHGAAQREQWARLTATSRQMGMEGMAYVIPDSTAPILAPNGTLIAHVSLPNNSYVWGFSAYSQRPQGFDVLITDLTYDNAWWPFSIRWDNLSQQGSTPEGIGTPLFLLSEPHLVIEPGNLDIQIRNLSSATNEVQLVMFVIQPEGL